MVSVAPKLLCRWCDSKESHSEYEDDVIYGEVRYPDEPHCKHMHNAHCSNALYRKCNESTNGNSDNSTSAKDNNVPTRERYVLSYNPDISLHNDDFIVVTPESMQMILDKKTTTKDNNLVNEREATCTPEVPPHYGSSMDDDDDDEVIMTQNPSYHNLPKENNNTVPKREATHMHTLDASLCGDDDDEVAMSRNPSYNLRRDFLTEDILDSAKLLPACVRVIDLTPHISPYNDSDYVGVAQTASCSLEEKFPAEPNKISDVTKLAANYLVPIPSHNSRENHKAIRKPDVNTDSIVMTKNPSYQSDKDFIAEQKLATYAS